MENSEVIVNCGECGISIDEPYLRDHPCFEGLMELEKSANYYYKLSYGENPPENIIEINKLPDVDKNLDPMCGECGQKIEEDYFRLHFCFKGQIYLYNKDNYNYKLKLGKSYPKQLLLVIDTLPDNPKFKETEPEIVLTDESMNNDSSSRPNSIADNNVQVTLNDMTNIRLWTDSMIKLLLRQYIIYKKMWDERKIKTKRQLVVHIVNDMKAQGYDVSWDQVDSKIRALNKKYKEKQDNKGSKQTRRGRLNVENEELLEEAFGKSHAANPKELIGVDWEKTNSSPDNSIDKDETLSIEETQNHEKLDDEEEDPKKGENDDKDDKIEKSSQKNESKQNKKRKYNISLAVSDKFIKEKMHKENIDRKDKYIALKEEEIKNKKDQRKELILLKQMELDLKKKKYKAKYPNFELDN